MKERSIYFAKGDIYQKIRDVGGQWNDSKERPIVCLIKSTEHEDLYWAIPVGQWNHRDVQAQQRIEKFMNYPDNDIRSCYYHIGKTTVKSIFFISDAIPITSEYIEKIYLGHDNNHYIIKNNKLIEILTVKLKRILSFEDSRKNYFRQHITDVKLELIKELNNKH